MLLNNKKVLKAKKYQIIRKEKDSHLILPVGDETEEVDVDPVQLVFDFSSLISEYAKCENLRVWHYPLSYAGVSSKEAQNQITVLNRHIFKEQALMEYVLMAFINKYGLFGLLNDEAVFDYEEKQEDGSYHLMQYPVSAIIPDENGLHFRVIPYEEYIGPHFPGVPVKEAIRLSNAARICRYAEYMEDILQNKRFSACAEYIAGIDKQNSSVLRMQGLNAVLSFKNDVPNYDITARSLIEYCHSMFFLNEISGHDKKISICRYKRCHRPFIVPDGSRQRHYCSDSCMRNANKANKKGEKSNG